MVRTLHLIRTNRARYLPGYRVPFTHAKILYKSLRDVSSMPPTACITVQTTAK